MRVRVQAVVIIGAIFVGSSLCQTTINLTCGTKEAATLAEVLLALALRGL